MKKIGLVNCIYYRSNSNLLRKDVNIMKKTIAKTAAFIMAAMMASAAMPLNIYAVPSGGTTSSSSDVELQTALTTVKKRVTIPAELDEFEYDTSESYKTKTYHFTWHRKNDSAKRIEVSVVGGIIINYGYYDYSKNSYNAGIAKLTNDQITKKAEEYIYQLDPSFKDKIKSEIGNLSINNDRVTVNFTRYENNIRVTRNGGSVTIDKNTGELYSFSADWWDNAAFDSPKKAKTEKEIEEAYKSLCRLTPYYKISTDYTTNEKTARIVYEPDFCEEIDAFTGKKSTIWEDMDKAEGRRYYGDYMNVTEATDAAADVEEDAEAGESLFTESEMKKIEIDKSLITPEKAFEQLKKDKFAALTDDYEIQSYYLYSDTGLSYDDPMPLAEDDADSAKKEEKEPEYYLSITFCVKSSLKEKFKGYKNVNVNINAKTGKVESLSKYSKSGELPKLDVTKAKAISDSVALTYGKDIISAYKSNKDNTAPVSTWGDKNQYYETSREFNYNRYVHGIPVFGDNIYVTVDSEGTVTSYRYNHTEDVSFPSSDILTPEEAFDKLYAQEKFDLYYDGWITKDGKVKTYLIYKMDSFHLNAKSGKLCYWDGTDMTERIDTRKIKYTDIKGIPQEKAILELQRHGAMLSEDKKFRPTENIEREEFISLLNSALNGYYSYTSAVNPGYEEVLVMEDVEEESGTEKETSANSKYITRTEAAVIFTNNCGFGNYTELKGIFKTPFSDVKSNDENIGAIAIAYAKGFLKGEDGKFNGSRNITRAEAAQIIYDYIVKNQDKTK